MEKIDEHRSFGGQQLRFTHASKALDCTMTFSVYLPPAVGQKVLPAVASKSPGEVWFNPGAESPELMDEARKLGLNAIAGCMIVNLGMSPSQFPDE